VYSDPAKILASCASISKRKGASSPGPEVFFNTRSNQTSFCFSFPGIGTEARTGISADVIGCCVSSVVFSYCLRYDFSDRVPVGWGVASCAVKACFSFSESLREGIVTLSSSGEIETTLQDFSFGLGFFEFHCLSLARSECTYMISLVFNVSGKRPLSSCCFTEGLLTSSRALKTGGCPSETVTFGKVPNSRVTIFAVTFFCYNFKVKTLASTKA